ncbi:hypothetical protein KUTeg_010756 [Tegillarca granosa]|uniref:Uncharacterized protein n=1 Tax=Tegillarca granosa TaxID=220873 RepID=A0ABQ9F496_TEGGR|nr:hypothetical protein KUTeg_010756 [Tegillarca granosa]
MTYNKDLQILLISQVIAVKLLVSFSTISSNLNALCAQTWEDILKPFLNHKSENFKSWVTRIIVLIYGTLGVAITFLVRNVSGTVLQAVISFSAAGGGPLTGIIVLGALFPWANWIGAIVGSLASYAIIMWLNVAQYSLIPAPNTNRFPSDNCSVASLNSSFISTSTSSILTNLTTTIATTGHREL